MSHDWTKLASYHLQYKKVNKFADADFKIMIAKRVLVKHNYKKNTNSG